MDYSRLVRNWTRWAMLSGLTNVYTECDHDGAEILFHSSDNSIYLRRLNGNWWSVDSVNERGKRLNDIAQFSSYSLVEKFLTWRWASLGRSAVGARQLGAELQKKGRADGVLFGPSSRPYFLELTTEEGSAIVAEAHSIVFSHVMCMTIDEIEAIVAQDLPLELPEC